MIPVLRPSCTQAELDAVAQVLVSGWWGQGQQCDELERQLSVCSGYRCVVTLNSATAALHLALVGLGIGPGDEVILPALTFVSTALAVKYVGAHVVFADVDPDTLCLDWHDVMRKVTRHTAAVIPVDYAGYPAMAEKPALGHVKIIEDAAHMPLGQHFGDLVCYSFHPVKPLAMGDGGAILTNSTGLNEHLRALRWCGIDRSTWQRSGKRYSWDYEISEIGYKYHLNDIQAAIGLVQLARYDTLLAQRRVLADRYRAELGQIAGVELPCDHPKHVWHLFTIRVQAERRDALIDYLAEHGVGTSVHYKPLTYYSPFKGPTPPVTLREWKRLISLPMYSDLSEADQTHVIRMVKEGLRA